MAKPTAFQNWLAQPADESDGSSSPTDASLPILVVGAGPAGLAAMAALRSGGIEFTGVESHERAGGIWDISNPTSSVYEGMRTVTSRHTTHLGPPIPGDWPNYIPHERAHEYLTRFCQDEQLLPQVRFRTKFEDATKSGSGTWQVKLRDVGEDREYEESFRAIVFATGAHNRGVTVMPKALCDEATACGIKVMHSAEYKDPAEFAGKRVLIVGIGNSGSDIADKISMVAARTMIAVRTNPWIIPQTALGVPCDKLTADTAWLPRWYTAGSFHVIRWLSVGGFRRLGLRTPKHGLNDRLPIGNRGIVEAIRAGRVEIRSNVTGFRDGVVCLENPQHPAEPIDVAMFATGFSRHYPLLCDADSSVNDVANALSFLIFHKHEPGLAYMAESVGFRGCWPVFAEQGRAVAAYFAAEQRGASNVRRFNSRRALPSPDFKGDVFHAADNFHVDYDVYERALRDLTTWLAN